MAERGSLYRDEGVPRHVHDGASHTHLVLRGETEVRYGAGKVKIRTAADRPLWLPPGVEHEIVCRLPGTVFFNSEPR